VIAVEPGPGPPGQEKPIWLMLRLPHHKRQSAMRPRIIQLQRPLSVFSVSFKKKNVIALQYIISSVDGGLGSKLMLKSFSGL